MVFPALFSSYFGLYTENLEPFELGHQAVFVITSNVIIFGLGILYYKKKIPSTLNNAIEKVRTFELSKRVTLVSLFVIIGVYVGFSIPELFIDESTQWGDYEVLDEALGHLVNLIMFTSKNKTTDMLECFYLMYRMIYFKISSYCHLLPLSW